ncbi:MAG TPA: sigma-70 family RNA polymerase sigma factor [Vicinamibacterales bacterium]|nr:sigma-70 family RNA polymerase sigma factor [Vicinamibacterales bacterium]
MAGPLSHELTAALRAWTAGDESALEKLTPLVEAELRRLAHHYLARERSNHTLQTTALINEAWLRLIDWKQVSWQDRAHFFGVSARLMRHILVGFARTRKRQKRGGAAQHVSLDAAAEIGSDRSDDLVALDDALQSLERYDPRKCRIVELRFFGGLTVNETAEALRLSPITIIREWNKARAWLYQELNPEPTDGARPVAPD